MNIKHLSAAGLSLAIIFTFSHSGLGSPTPVPSIFGSSTPTPKRKLSGVDVVKYGAHPSPSPTLKRKLSGVDIVKYGAHPSSPVPAAGGSGSGGAPVPGTGPVGPGGKGGGGGAFPGGGMGGGGGHGTLVIAPIVLPYPNAVVQAEPGQIILPAGSHIPDSVAQLAAETGTSGERGCLALTVSTLWNGSFGPYSKVNMAVEARNCRPNHRYGVALFSSDSDAAKSPVKIGALQTDQDGYGFQALEYGPGNLVLNYTVGLYELDGDNMIAGPMTQAWAGKIGSPGTL